MKSTRDFLKSVTPSARDFLTVVTPAYAGLKNTANVVYGAAAATYTLEFVDRLKDTGIPDAVFNTLAPVSMVISAFGVLDGLYNEFTLLQRMYKNKHDDRKNLKTDWRHVDNLLKLASSGTLFAAGYTYASETVTFGSSVALQYLCGAMAIQAAVRLVRDIKHYRNASKNYKIQKNGEDKLNESDKALLAKATSDLAVSLMNFIGWTSLCLAHIPALAAAAPALIGVGAAFLVAGGLYAGYAAYRNYSNYGSKGKEGIAARIAGFFAHQTTLETDQEKLAEEVATTGTFTKRS